MTDDCESSAPHPPSAPMGSTLLGAIAFYTVLPIPPHWPLNFHGVARWAPLVGGLIGGLCSLVDWGLGAVQMPVAVRSAGVIALALALTGGLHLDGAMDTADGLAVMDPQRRLEVMADSRSGAFGVMAAVIILLLKVVALTQITSQRWVMLMAVAGWGRWGQLVAIARYPYLRATGKGAFHKPAIPSLWSALPSLLLLIGFSSIPWIVDPTAGRMPLLLIGGGSLIGWGTGAWFHSRLGGHTGDTYGAVVEWTEALLLCLLTIRV